MSYAPLLRHAILALPDARREEAKRIMQERNLRRQIREYLRCLPETRVISMTGVQDTGCEDLVVCHRGLFLGIEVKTPRGKLSPAQEQVRRETRAAGGLWIKATSLGAVKALLAKIGETQP